MSTSQRAGDAEQRQLGVAHRCTASSSPDRPPPTARTASKARIAQVGVTRKNSTSSSGSRPGSSDAGHPVAGRTSSARRGSRTGPRPTKTTRVGGEGQQPAAASGRRPGCAARSPAARCRAGSREHGDVREVAHPGPGARRDAARPRPGGVRRAPGGGLGVVGLGDRADHDDPAARRPRAPRRGRSASMPPIANQGRVGAARPRTGSGPGRGPAGPAWSASARSGRRRSSRRPARRRPPSTSARSWVERPISGVVARRCAARGRHRQVVLAEVQHVGAGGRATSARSLTASSAPCRRAASANTSSSASSSRASRPFSRSCTMSTPPRSAASRNSARSPRSRRASVHR